MKRTTRRSSSLRSRLPHGPAHSSSKARSTMRSKRSSRSRDGDTSPRPVQPQIRPQSPRNWLLIVIIAGTIASISASVWWYWSGPGEEVYYSEYSYQEDASTAEFDLFSQPFEQPLILRALYKGDIGLNGVEANIPASAPIQYQGKRETSIGQKTTKKIYSFRLAIELESMMKQEWPKKSFTDVSVVLRDIVHSDIGSVARVRMESDSEAIVAGMSKDVTDWGKLAGSIAATFFGGDISDINRQARATAEFAQAVGGHAERDAGLLRDALYAGEVEGFRRIYNGLSRYVLGPDADH